MLSGQNEGSFATAGLKNTNLSKISWSRTFGSSVWDDARKLHEEVFGVSQKPQFDEAGRKPFPLLLVAYCAKGRPIGFKLGYELKSFRFYSWLGGVSPSERRSGVATELMRVQHQMLLELAYTEVETKTKNERKEMLILNIRSGFDVVGCYTDHTGEAKIILRKGL